MSAYICDNEHINSLAWFLKFDLECPESFEALARMLHAENVASVNARYRAQEEPLLVIQIPKNLLQVEVSEWVGSFSCYRYQACEHKGWKESKAYEYTTKALVTLAKKLAQSDCWGAPKTPAEKRAAKRAQV